MATLLPVSDAGVLTYADIQIINDNVTRQNANNTTLAAGAVTGADAITAHAGGGQGSAFALTAGINRITTCATIGNSVALPASVAGLFVAVINDAALSAQVFGAGTDTIDDVATATGVPLPGKSSKVFYCPLAGVWYTVGYTNFLGLQAITANGAILPRVEATYYITKAGVAAMTLAAPTTTTDDGIRIRIFSNTANAHTVTATGLFQDGAGHVNLATFAANAGASLILEAYQGKWNVISNQGVTMS